MEVFRQVYSRAQQFQCFFHFVLGATVAAAAGLIWSFAAAPIHSPRLAIAVFSLALMSFGLKVIASRATRLLVADFSTEDNARFMLWRNRLCSIRAL